MFLFYDFAQYFAAMSISSVGSQNDKPQKKTPNDFVFGKVIGEGSFATVSSAVLAKIVAILSNLKCVTGFEKSTCPLAFASKLQGRASRFLHNLLGWASAFLPV